jgi:hypothetical protein
MELKLVAVNRNHHAFEVKFVGNRVPTTDEVKAAVTSKYPEWEAVGISQEYLQCTFDSWYRYGYCTYITGSRLRKGD